MYQAVYKCRLCGKEILDKKIKIRKIEDFTITNILAQKEQTVFYEKPNNVDLHRMHDCADSSLGFADFLGFRKTEESNAHQ